MGITAYAGTRIRPKLTIFERRFSSYAQTGIFFIPYIKKTGVLPVFSCYLLRFENLQPQKSCLYRLYSSESSTER